MRLPHDPSAYRHSANYIVHPDVHPRYRLFEARYQRWFDAPGIEQIHDPNQFSIKRLLEDSEYQGEDFAHIIVKKGSEDQGISTGGVLTCHAVILRADVGHEDELIMLEHDGGVRDPRELFQAMTAQARQLGATNPHFEIIGGMSKGQGTEEGNTLQREISFMALIHEFKIDAVRLHVSHVDVDAQGRDVEGPRSHGVDVVATGRRTYFSHYALEADESSSGSAALDR